jgi:low affinity Fe/Cu permease
MTSRAEPAISRTAVEELGEAHDRSLRDRFNHLTAAITSAAGSPAALLAATALVVAWALSGPFFQFDATWMLLINTGTTIVTFLMVFVIQASQNRDAKALHLKLDEVIRAVEGARNEFIDTERTTQAELERRETELLAAATARGVSSSDSALLAAPLPGGSD